MNLYPKSLQKYILQDLKNNNFQEETLDDLQLKVNKYISYIKESYPIITNFPDVPFSYLYLDQNKHYTNIVEFVYKIWSQINKKSLFSVFNFLYQMIRDDNLNIEIIKIQFINSQLFYEDELVYDFETYEIYNEILYNKFIEVIQDKNYDVLLYDIKIQRDTSLHKNVLIITKDKDNNIRLNYYEPHGYQKLKVYPKRFLEHLNLVLDIKQDSLDEYIDEKRSKIRGLQSLMREYDIGYCVLFSLFWTYLSLNFLKKHKTFRISTIELFLYEFYTDNPELLLQKMLSFATLFINFCIQYYPEEIDIKLFSKISKKDHPHLENIINYYGKNKGEINDDCKDNDDCNSGYCFRGKCIHQFKVRPLNGECFMNEHCDSGYCDEGKCSLVPLYSKCDKSKNCLYGYCKNKTCLPKKNRSKCKVGKDCESGNCVLGKCIKKVSHK